MMNTVDSVARGLGLLGYEAGRPPWLSAADLDDDRLLYEHCECPACGHAGLTFQPYWRRPFSYRAVVRCPRCGNTEEA
jgi:hypothetical protein